MNPTLKVAEATVIAHNELYQFAVGRVEEQWVGYAIGHCNDHTRMLFYLNITGNNSIDLGLENRDEAIRRTAAMAQAPEHGYGGVDAWFIDEPLRASPDEYRCPHCEELFCTGQCAHAGDWFD